MVADSAQISIPPNAAVAVTEEITSHPEVMLIGLGARDSLRLEAGMCLYGHDLDETISPIEGALAWLVSEYDRNDAVAQSRGSQQCQFSAEHSSELPAS